MNVVSMDAKGSRSQELKEGNIHAAGLKSV
jgi:hypothetical protein